MAGRPASPSTQISRKIEQLEKLYDDIPENKQILAKELINRIAFLSYSVETLEKSMKGDGESAYSMEYQNGENQKGRTVSPEMKGYLAAVQRMESAINSLDKMVVRDAPPETESAIMNFIGKRK